MLSRVKETIIRNAKNSIGWKTKRKIVVFSVDDYGNVRIASKKARENMDNARMKIYSRFDIYDALETKQDLEQLYEILNSAKDKNGNHPIFTAFATPCNINFERMENENYLQFHNENLPETYQKLANLYPESYHGAWELWNTGIKERFLRPQFHGREHLNLKVFNQKLKEKDIQFLTALKNSSYTSISDEDFPTIFYTAAFDFWEENDKNNFKEIIKDGLDKFEQVFGYRSNYFTPPVYNISSNLFETLIENGIKFIDLGLIRKEHLGENKYKRSLNYLGKQTESGLTIMVRNVVFEPTDNRGINWVDFTLKQIETAFKWRKPAIISSHRVNFCGHIEPENRLIGLSNLKILIQKIVTKWPDVEFMTADELGKLMLRNK